MDLLTDLGWASALAGPVTGHRCVLLGEDVTVEWRPVADEWERRAEWSLGGVPDRSLLRVLFELPTDVPVPQGVLSPRQLRLLRRAPAGVCDFDGKLIIRRLVPALRLLRVELESTPTVSALRRLSQFAPFAPRTLLSSRATVGTDVLVEAARLGIGVRTGERGFLMDPVFSHPSRHTAAAWLISEAVTSQVC